MTVLLVDDRSYLTVANPCRYAFGNPDAPLLTLNAADAYGCAWLVDVPDGWAAPEVSSPLDRRQDGHGGILGASYFTERTLSFAGGMVTAPTPAALAAAERRWRAALLSALDGYVQYTHLDEEPRWSLWLRPIGQPKWRAEDERVATFAFDMVAEDPIKFGPTRTYGPSRLPSGTGDPGRVYGRTYGYTYSTGGSAARPDVVTVPNVGDEWAHAVYTVTGPVPRPLILLSTGARVGLTIDLGALDTLTVDTLAGTVQVNGINRPDALAPDSSFPLIPGSRIDPATGQVIPGGAEVRLRSGTGGNDPAASLTVTTAPRQK